jgi:hypothetical protein
VAWSSRFAALGLAMTAASSGCCLMVDAPTSAGGTSTGAATGSASSSGSGTTSAETGASSSGGTTSGQTGTSSSGGTTGSSTGQTNIGTLWIGGLVALSPATLAQSGTASFDMVCAFPGSTALAPIEGFEAIDGRGDLWAFDPGGILYMWTPDQLSADCRSEMPEITLDLGWTLSSLAFDSAGNLWGTNYSVSALYGYRAADLQTSGQLAPAWTVHGLCESSLSLCFPAAIAFDASGYLWVGQAYGLLAYSPATLMAATDGGRGDFALLAPCNRNLPDAGECDGQPGFGPIAFDADGNLWVLNTPTPGEYWVMEYSRAQLQNLASEDQPQPNKRIDYGAEAPAWEALAFDSDGNLWLASDASYLARFAPATLLDGGPPDVTIDMPAGLFPSMAFSPIPAGLPIRP